MVDRVVETASSVCDAVVVVLPPRVAWDGPPVAIAVAGGATRLESVRRGLAEIDEAVPIIVVHDAAHPLATPALFRAVIDAVDQGWDAALPACPVTETIKQVAHGQVVASIPRDGLMLAQTPHAFRANVLRAAHAGGGESVEDTMLVEAMGGRIAVLGGDATNIHVSTPEELRLAELMVERASTAGGGQCQ